MSWNYSVVRGRLRQCGQIDDNGISFCSGRCLKNNVFFVHRPHLTFPTNARAFMEGNYDRNPWWIPSKVCLPMIFRTCYLHYRKTKLKVQPIWFPHSYMLMYLYFYISTLLHFNNSIILAISENEHSLTESLDSVSELPNTAGQQLQHLVKSRPRRAKTRAPTRPMLRADLPVDGITLGEGLDVFFRPTTPTTPLISPTSDDR